MAASTIADCAGSELLPTASNLQEVRSATLCLIDLERTARGQAALAPNAALERVAQGHSEDMAARAYFEHNSPEGQTPLQRVEASGYLANPELGCELAENIAWGSLEYATPAAVVAAWMASPDHSANILTAGYRESGIGVSPDLPASFAEGEPGAIYTQDFATILAADTPATSAPKGAVSPRRRRTRRRRRARPRRARAGAA